MSQQAIKVSGCVNVMKKAEAASDNHRFEMMYWSFATANQQDVISLKGEARATMVKDLLTFGLDTDDAHKRIILHLLGLLSLAEASGVDEIRLGQRMEELAYGGSPFTDTQLQSMIDALVHFSRKELDELVWELDVEMCGRHSAFDRMLDQAIRAALRPGCTTIDHPSKRDLLALVVGIS